MDNSEANIHELEARLGVLLGWWESPVAMELRSQTTEKQQQLLQDVLNQSPVDIATFVLREQSLGELKGLRFVAIAVETEIEELKQQIKDLR